MKLTIARDALLSALERARRVVEKRNTIPILSNVLLKAQGAGLTLTGTDLDMEVRTTAAAEVAAPGAVTVPAQVLYDFMRKLPEGAQVQVEALRSGVLIKSGRSRVTLNTMPDADFPELAAGDFPHTFDLRADTLATMFERVSFAISSEETRYYLNGIYLHVPAEPGAPEQAQGAVANGATSDGPHLRAVATDGHRLASHQVLAPEGTAGMAGIILPRKAVAEIGRLLKPLGEETVTLAVSTTKLRLTAGVTTLTTKLIDGTFPDYRRVIPAGNDRLATMETAALAASVDRVTTVTSDRGNAVKFSFAAGAPLTLSVRETGSGDAADEVDGTYEGEPLEIGFNGRYVLDTLGAMPGKRLRLALGDAGSPALFTPEGDDTSLFVLMPMRV
ncbi:DNA polymerase III subunit beta [Xanthobacter autotrophicus]|uniref:DNA polymerase III subunit beta n=1 Tax=Xanthobacter autotrophicus TaxID=280 RepID=UPI00372C0790